MAAHATLILLLAGESIDRPCPAGVHSCGLLLIALTLINCIIYAGVHSCGVLREQRVCGGGAAGQPARQASHRQVGLRGVNSRAASACGSGLGVRHPKAGFVRMQGRCARVGVVPVHVGVHTRWESAYACLPVSPRCVGSCAPLEQVCCFPLPRRLYRNILADKPRVTKFNIE